MDPDGEQVGHHRPLGRRDARDLELALEAPQQLDGLEACPEDAGRGALEEALEEPLEGGEWLHVGGRESSRGGRSALAAMSRAEHRVLPSGPGSSLTSRVRAM